MWEVRDRGFLPANNPIPSLEFEPQMVDIEYLASQIPKLLEQTKFRDECVSFLSDNVGMFFLENAFDEETTEKLFKHYCYFASAYIHALNEAPIKNLPSIIAIPLVGLATKLKRLPILSYSSYCLNNWVLKNPTDGINMDNLVLQQNFSLSNKKDEDWFILIHVDIEAKAAQGISALRLYYLQETDDISWVFSELHQSLKNMNATMNRMPECCSEDFYFKAVRPFIFGFENVVYDGCYSDQPQNYRGETGAQSSIVPLFVAALGISHKNSMLTQHLEIMRDYMPAEHEKFVNTAENLPSLCLYSNQYPELYNACLEELLAFRTRHLEYAVNYIQKKVDNPKGTGGTPFIPWLSQLREETEQHFVR